MMCEPIPSSPSSKIWNRPAGPAPTMITSVWTGSDMMGRIVADCPAVVAKLARLAVAPRVAAAHEREFVAVRVAHVAGVEVGVVLRPQSRRALRRTAMGERRRMEVVDLPP